LASEANLAVVLADDHPLVLTGLRLLLEQQGGFEVMSACSNGAAALDDLRRLEPDLAVLDISMPQLNGLSVLEAVEADGLRTRVILLTATATDAQVLRAVELGCWGIILKDAASASLVSCLRTVASGKRWLPEDFISVAIRREAERKTALSRFDLLTSRELEICHLVADGHSNKQIARITNISPGTVKIHLHNSYQKLGVRSRTALVTTLMPLRS
jgi:DNA-binding NarL/FixJ family response regulator